MTYKLGSLFDGSGGFPLAGSLCGIEPVWAAEVEPYPIAVTRSRFPNMKHYGDVSKINGAEVEPVDIITFGSPCQDLSVAGKRAGLKHEDNGDDETTRSGLFMEAIRIIKEMREATNGMYPAFAVWENVPGAFSSNKGEDFRIVLQELIQIVEPGAVMPAIPQGGWAYADHYSGDGWSLAYRILDAQYWGVPQRRRRIYLVLHLTGQRAGEVLFERNRLHRNPAACGAAWEEVAGDAEGGVGADDKAGNCLTPWDVQSRRCFSVDGPWPALYGGEGGGHGYVVIPKEQYLFENHSQDTRYSLSANKHDASVVVKVQGINGDVAGTLDANYYKGCGLRQGVEREVVAFGISSYDSNAMKSSNPHSGIYEATTSRTLDLNGGNPACNQGGIAIVEQRLMEAYQHHGYRESDTAGTLTAEQNNHTRGDTPLVVEQKPEVAFQTYQKVTGPLMANSHPGSYTGQDAFSDMLVAGKEHRPVVRYIVRRLIPTECARLQGFPDFWGHPDHKDNLTDEEYAFWLDVRNTHAAINGKEVKEYTREQMLKWYNKLHTDSSEYKMWGNGIALPCALYVMQGIEDALKEES